MENCTWTLTVGDMQRTVMASIFHMGDSPKFSGKGQMHLLRGNLDDSDNKTFS